MRGIGLLIGYFVSGLIMAVICLLLLWFLSAVFPALAQYHAIAIVALLSALIYTTHCRLVERYDIDRAFVSVFFALVLGFVAYLAIGYREFLTAAAPGPALSGETLAQYPGWLLQTNTGQPIPAPGLLPARLLEMAVVAVVAVVSGFRALD